LIPFAKKCKKDQSNIVIQENKASAHAHVYQKDLFSLHEIQCLLWFDNSSDLNMIESCWFWMKRRTTAWEASRERKTVKAAWCKTWNDLSQEKIQQWIERISHHCNEIIRFEKENEYKKDHMNQARSWKKQRLKKKISYRENMNSDTRYQRESTAKREEKKIEKETEKKIVKRKHEKI
jgi:hypothetical protein